ncbi:multiple coagulation factor deficiency protein 2 homolog isoform X1 [Ciona intestinalis]
MKAYVLYISLILLLSTVLRCTATGSTASKVSFGDGKLVRDIEHIKGELGGLVEMAMTNMNLEHLEFYYFRLHDLNKDEILDGNELYAALSEGAVNFGLSEDNSAEKEKYLIEAVDHLLEETDANDDGLVTWLEYLAKTRDFVDM